MKLLTRQGYLIEEAGMSYLGEIAAGRALTPLQAASCTYRIALGPRAGHKVLSLQTVPGRAAQPAQALCANAHGFEQSMRQYAAAPVSASNSNACAAPSPATLTCPALPAVPRSLTLKPKTGSTTQAPLSLVLRSRERHHAPGHRRARLMNRPSKPKQHRKS